MSKIDIAFSNPDLVFKNVTELRKDQQAQKAHWQALMNNKGSLVEPTTRGVVTNQ